MGKDLIFEMEDLSFHYGRTRAVDNLSLTLSSGCFWGLLGPNGCGKSTLLDLMARCKTPQAGIIKYRGRDIRDYGSKVIAREIALVPQDFHVNFPFTVEEILLMGRHPYIPRFASPSSDDLQVVDQVMEVLKIAKFRHNYITELSGGEKQRVIFARALAQDTPVVLLDEATSNMDIRHTLDILDIVAGDVETGGKTVIAALHNLNLAATYCDKLVFMKSGRVVSHGDRDQVLTEETLYEVFGIESRVYFDEYVGSRQVVFRRRTL